MSDEIIEKLRTLSTSSVSDAMDRLGIAGQCLGIKPLSTEYTSPHAHVRRGKLCRS